MDSTLALSLTLSSLLAMSSLPAQRDLFAGFGSEPGGNEFPEMPSTMSLGIQHLEGEIFLPDVNGLAVKVFDSSANPLRAWSQPVGQGGFHDGASDGLNLFWGSDQGIYIVDKNGLSVQSLRARSGSIQIPGGVIAGNFLANVDVARALAFDPRGNGGDGSFWVGDLGVPICEIDTAGNVIRVRPAVDDNSIGFALDPVSLEAGSLSRMWITSNTDARAIVEYNLNTGVTTGVSIARGTGPGGYNNGLDLVPGSLARGALASGADILYLRPSVGQVPERLKYRRLHLDIAGTGFPASPITRLGTLEPDLLGSVDDEATTPRSDKGVLAYDIDSSAFTIHFDIERNPGDGMGTSGLNGVPAVIFANVGPDAAIGLNAMSNLLGIRELAHLQPSLTGIQPQFAVRGRGVVLSNDPMSPSEWRVAVTPGQPFQGIGECVRFQGLWIDQDVNFLPIALTNQIRLCRDPNP